MKLLLSTILLLFALLTFGQITKDTIWDYNGRQANVKIEFDKEGHKIKETVLYDNGKTETEYLYSDNKNVYWISYDTTGTKRAEWQDPEVENSKHRRTRNTTLTIISFILISLTCWTWKKIGYTKTYCIIGYSTIISPLILILEKSIEQLDEWFLYSLSSVVFILPLLLLLLSISNFFRKTHINIFVSIVFTIISAFILLLYTTAILTAGAGMLS